MQWIIGNYIFGFFGAVVRWVFYTLKSILTQDNNKVSFSNVWLGSKTNMEGEDLSNNMVNVILGIIVFVIIADIFIRLGY